MLSNLRLRDLHAQMAALLVLLCLLAPAAARSTALVGTADYNGALALSDAITAYQMLSPAITIAVTTPLEESTGLSQLLNGTLDFISTTGLLSPNLTNPASPFFNAEAADLLWCPYLIAPLVPIYRLDSIVGTTPLTLSTATLCAVYTGSITWWNDSRITSINTGLTLPKTPITVVVEASPSALTRSFTQAMSAVCSQFASSIGVTGTPVWPTASYAGFTPSSLPSSTVLITNGAIAFSTLPAALAASASVASMLNAKQQPVVASAMSALFAATELLALDGTDTLTGGQSSSTFLLLPITLEGATGQQAWPLTLVSSIVLHTNMTRSDGNCETRAALVSFVNFLYTSSVATAIFANRQYAAYPPVALNDLLLPGLLQTAILCGDGLSAYDVASEQLLQSTNPPPRTHTLYGDARFSTALDLIAGLYTEEEQKEGEAIDIRFAGSSNIWQGVQAVLSGEAEAALLAFDTLNDTQLDTVLAARASGLFYLLPLFISALVPVYNPQLTANLSLPPKITLTPPALLTMSSTIKDWRSPALAATLAPLSLVNLSTPLPIRIMTSCNASAPGASLQEYFSVVLPFVPGTYIPRSALGGSCNSSRYDSSAYVVGQPHGVFPVPTSDAVQSAVQAVYGAFSFQRATAHIEPAVVWVDFGTGAGGVTANVSSMLACLDTFNAQTMMAQLNVSANPACYALSRTVYALVPTSIVDAAGDGCAARSQMLEFLQQLTEADTYDPLLNNELLVRAGQVQAVRNAVLDALNSITCVEPVSGEWDTILVQTPIVWSLSSAITNVGLALGAVGIVCAVTAFALTAVFHRHTVMRAASPVFLALTLLGLAVMFVSALTLALPPSTGSCAGLSWCFHLGCQLAFAPLLAKTYRIYRIYGGQKLRAVKLSSSRLALIVAALLTVEVGLLTALQIVSPIRPLIVSRSSGSPLRVHDYGQCSVDSAGMPLFLALCIEKGVVLLVGALMAFSTRRVSSTYSESSGIAWSIYNLLLSMAVLLPLVLLIDAVGDTLVALLLFALLWVSAFTLAVLFVPRLAAMLSRAEALDERDSGARVVDGDGFSFLSLASFEGGGGAMAQYVAAMEMHLAQAKARHSQIKQGDAKGKEWMKPNTAGRKQSIGSIDERSATSSPQPQPLFEQKRLRQKSIASTTATAAPKPSISYLTQTNYSGEMARSNTSSPKPALALRLKPSLAPSARTLQASNSAANTTGAVTPADSGNTSAAPAPDKRLTEQHEAGASNEAPTEVVTVRPSSVSRSRSRSNKVQPFDPVSGAPLEKRASASRTTATPSTAQVDGDNASGAEQGTEKEAAATEVAASSLALPALPVADDMVVHDLSSRLPAAPAHEEAATATQNDGAAEHLSPTHGAKRPRAHSSSKGILMTPVVGSAALSARGSSEEEAAVAAAGEIDRVQSDELDVEAGDDVGDME